MAAALEMKVLRELESSFIGISVMQGNRGPNALDAIQHAVYCDISSQSSHGVLALMEVAAMAREQHDYDDIPGTFVFDAERSRQGYGINMFCMSLMKDENRKAFKANEAEYLKKFKLSPEQTEAILKRQYNRMLELGGNIYFTAKLGATDGHSFQHLAALMTGSTQETYAKMMLGGGRSVEGNRSKSGKPAKAKSKASKKSGKKRG
jgi:protocatechuate 4,5-dioxygenase alpha chain